jgi:ADP-ribosyl-[dinitrogen reductase] hydrolase
MARTSVSHPLQIAEVACGAGFIGLTFCPGKKGPSAYGTMWDRDLEQDLDRVQDWRADVVVTLMETHELDLLGVSDLGRAVLARGLEWYHLPIVDVSTPDPAFEQQWGQLGLGLRSCLARGGRILVHCRGGLGRTGLIAARLLIEFGEDAETAISIARGARPGAIETAAQEAYVRKLRPAEISPAVGEITKNCEPAPAFVEMTAPSRLDRFRGLLLGGAVGDALGAPVEFLQRDQILRRFGANGITTYAPAYGRVGAVTDDTQMMLFTLEGLIRARVRWLSRGICDPRVVIDNAYRRWRATQEGRRNPSTKLDGWLINVDALWSRRAPGNTCLSAMDAKASESPGKPAKNDSKGAGGIMRVGPVGLYAEDAYRLGCEAAALTHGHISGIVAAGWFAAWIGGIADGATLREAAEAAWERCRGEAPELDQMLELAFHQLRLGENSVVPAVLGEGWIAEEAAAIALWSVLVTADPIEALRLAVNIDGDSDTTGTLVGQVFGAAFGPGWIPKKLLDLLELRTEIEQLAQDAVDSLTLSSELDPLTASAGFERVCDLRPIVKHKFATFALRYPGW